jgi:hypothetical protein
MHESHHVLARRGDTVYFPPRKVERPGTGSTIDGEAQGFGLQGFALLEPTEFEDAAQRRGKQIPDARCIILHCTIAIRVRLSAGTNIPACALP